MLLLHKGRLSWEAADSLLASVADAACALVRDMESLELLSTQFTVPSTQWAILEDKPKLCVLDTYVSAWSADDLKVLALLRNLPPLEKISPLPILGSDDRELSLLADLRLPLVHLTLKPAYGARWTTDSQLGIAPLTRMRDTLRSLILRDTFNEIIAGSLISQRLLARALASEGALAGLEELGEFRLETLEAELAAAICARSTSLRHLHFSCIPSTDADVWNRLVPHASSLQLTVLTTLTLDILNVHKTRVESPTVWQALAAFIGRSLPNLKCLRIPIRFWRSCDALAPVMASNVELVLRAATQLNRFECGCLQKHDTDLRDLVRRVAVSMGLTDLLVEACDIS
jgi:hypothetical protein